VHREVFDDMHDRRERRHFKSLNRELIQQSFMIEVVQRLIGFAKRFAQASQQFVPWNHVALGKLSVAIAAINGTAKTDNNPLPDVPAEVQEQISNAVRGWICAPPNLFVRE
jgi:hypothetical protein